MHDKENFKMQNQEKKNDRSLKRKLEKKEKGNRQIYFFCTPPSSSSHVFLRFKIWHFHPTPHTCESVYIEINAYFL